MNFLRTPSRVPYNIRVISTLLTVLCVGCSSTPDPAHCPTNNAAQQRLSLIKDNAWLQQGLRGEVTGGDRQDAKSRAVEVMVDGDQALARIVNRWGLRCRMLFDQQGQLGALSDCEATEDRWKRVKVIETVVVQRAPIELSCSQSNNLETCRGRYQIRQQQQTSTHILRLERPLAAR